MAETIITVRDEDGEELHVIRQEDPLQAMRDLGNWASGFLSTSIHDPRDPETGTVVVLVNGASIIRVTSVHRVIRTGARNVLVTDFNYPS